MLISPAFAAAAPAPGGEAVFLQFLPMILIGVVFWFMLIRPQQKRAKELAAMLTTLKKGDEVSTGSGIVGRITQVTDDFFVLEVAEGSKITIQRGAVTSKLEAGSLKKVGL